MASRLATLALFAILLVTAKTIGASDAGFTASSANPGPLAAAASFPGIRVTTGTYTGNGADNRTISGVGFGPDVVIVKGASAVAAVLRTSQTSSDLAKPMTATAATTNLIQAFGSTSFQVGTSSLVNQSGTVYRWTAIQAEPGTLEIGSYTGNGSTSRSVTGLGFSPEYLAVLTTTAAAPVQAFEGMSGSYRFDTGAVNTNQIKSLDAAGFTVGSDATVNTSGTAYAYVAFNETPGVIEVGSYTGNGADNRSITGVGFSPDWLNIRQAASRRGIHRPAALTGDSGQSFSATANAANTIQALQADGFQVGSDANVNAAGSTNFFLALKDRP